jgi:molybdenum cofactor biosynthesis enzyme MoaA
MVTCSKVTISGGEPLLREDLYDVLTVLRAHDAPMVLATNGTLLTVAKIESLVRAGIKTFQLPLHSADSTTHNVLSGGDCWNSTISAIVDVMEAGVSAVPVFVATGINLAHFPAVLKACSWLGVKDVIFNRFVPTGLGTIYRDSIGVPTESMLLEILHESNVLAEQLDLVIHLGMPISIPSDQWTSLKRVKLASCPVGSGQRRWTVDTAGNLRRCNQSEVQFGSLLRGATEMLVSEVNKMDPSTSAMRTVKQCGILAQQRLVHIS